MLSREVYDWVVREGDEYPYFVEVSSKIRLARFMVWADANLSKRVFFVTMNAAFPPRKVCATKYCIAPLSRFLDGGYFFGFVNSGDRRMFINRFRRFVVEEEPFATKFKIER